MITANCSNRSIWCLQQSGQDAKLPSFCGRTQEPFFAWEFIPPSVGYGKRVVRDWWVVPYRTTSINPQPKPAISWFFPHFEFTRLRYRIVPLFYQSHRKVRLPPPTILIFRGRRGNLSTPKAILYRTRHLFYSYKKLREKGMLYNKMSTPSCTRSTLGNW